MSYLDVGYNQFISREIQGLDPLFSDPFASEIDGERVLAGINAANITTGQMSFDRAQGGILRLGGVNNVNGQFALSDANGNDRITMDKDGIIIKDDNQQTFIDSKGIISTTTFNTQSVVLEEDVTFTGATATFLPGSTLRIVTERPVHILYSLYIAGYATQVNDTLDASGNIVFFVKQNGDLTTNVGVSVYAYVIDASGIKENMAPCSHSVMSTTLVQPGETLLSIYYQIFGNTNLQYTLVQANFSYVILGS